MATTNILESAGGYTQVTHKTFHTTHMVVLIFPIQIMAYLLAFYFV